MPHESPSQETTFGYLSTLESAEHGYFGGYLIVSPLGRPLEFHCTAPVRPSRAQEILYGPTLQPYLLGEQICGALLEAAKLTAAADSHRLRSRAAGTIAYRCRRLCLCFAKCNDGARDEAGVDMLHQHVNRATSRSSFGDYELQLPSGFERDRIDASTQADRTC